MKKILCIFGAVASITSATSSAYFGINSSNFIVDNFTESHNQEKSNISIQLSNYFEHVSDKQFNYARNISTFNDTFVLDYIEYENNFLFINFERLEENIASSNELISILKQDEFSYQLNSAFQLGMFEYVGNGVGHIPYEEKAQLNTFQKEMQKNDNRLSRNNTSWDLSPINGGRWFTRWFWFGTFEIDLNNSMTRSLISFLSATALIVNNRTVQTKLLTVFPKVGAIIIIILKVIATYLILIANRFREVNVGRGITFRVTIIFVHSIRAR